MILSTLRMTIPPKKRGDALRILRSVAELCRVHSSCLGCHIYEDVQEDNVLMFEEMWRSEEDLAQHLRSEKYRNVLKVLEMALNQPEIRFDTISSSAGIETIEKARSTIKS
jgi:quinol monooxygenase YgiN